MDVLDYTLLAAAALVGGVFGAVLGMMVAAFIWNKG